MNKLCNVVFGITCCVLQGAAGQPGDPGNEGEIGLAVSTLHFILYMSLRDTTIH